jgi:hypothetical protein
MTTPAYVEFLETSALEFPLSADGYVAEGDSATYTISGKRGSWTLTLHPKDDDKAITVNDPFPTYIAELDRIVDMATDKPRMQLVCSLLDATGVLADLSPSNTYMASSAVGRQSTLG